ncbi:hypothetical protein C8R45DRAFT_1024258 [Mycena sanguinolenta]|nr:hypothetical protein C8R45DRAFT_1024258 [Mycena sanguinolenta]
MRRCWWVCAAWEEAGCRCGEGGDDREKMQDFPVGGSRIRGCPEISQRRSHRGEARQHVQIPPPVFPALVVPTNPNSNWNPNKKGVSVGGITPAMLDPAEIVDAGVRGLLRSIPKCQSVRVRENTLRTSSCRWGVREGAGGKHCASVRRRRLRRCRGFRWVGVAFGCRIKQLRQRRARRFKLKRRHKLHCPSQRLSSPRTRTTPTPIQIQM